MLLYVHECAHVTCFQSCFVRYSIYGFIAGDFVVVAYSFGTTCICSVRGVHVCRYGVCASIPSLFNHTGQGKGGNHVPGG